MTDDQRRFRQNVGLSKNESDTPHPSRQGCLPVEPITNSHRELAVQNDFRSAWRDREMMRLIALAGKLGIDELKKRVAAIERLLMRAQ